MSERRNINRAYMRLIVWQDAKAYWSHHSNIPAFQYPKRRRRQTK